MSDVRGVVTAFVLGVLTVLMLWLVADEIVKRETVRIERLEWADE